MYIITQVLEYQDVYPLIFSRCYFKYIQRNKWISLYIFFGNGCVYFIKIWGCVSISHSLCFTIQLICNGFYVIVGLGKFLLFRMVSICVGWTKQLPAFAQHRRLYRVYLFADAFIVNILLAMLINFCR